jgi:hypothetical protein
MWWADQILHRCRSYTIAFASNAPVWQLSSAQLLGFGIPAVARVISLRARRKPIELRQLAKVAKDWSKSTESVGERCVVRLSSSPMQANHATRKRPENPESDRLGGATSRFSLCLAKLSGFSKIRAFRLGHRRTTQFELPQHRQGARQELFPCD